MHRHEANRLRKHRLALRPAAAFVALLGFTSMVAAPAALGRALVPSPAVRLLQGTDTPRQLAKWQLYAPSVRNGVWTPQPQPRPSATTPPTVAPPDHGPDLVLSSMNVGMEDGTCDYGQPIGTRIAFKNRGDGATGPFLVRVGNQFRAFPSGLEPGETGQLWFSEALSETTLFVDATDLVRETNENNNRVTTQLPLPTPPVACSTPTPAADAPNLVVESMAGGFEDVGCDYGQPLGTWITVANAGGGAAGPFVLSVNGERRAIPSGLDAGGSATMWCANYRYFGAGPTVGLVDVTDVVTETNEEDNELRQLLPVPIRPPACPTATPASAW